ncbi:NAD(P)H-dependent glycerol-3-phosphate dehydrogenase [Polynucleobacter kasalickyi]|uniref:Glycerol-3-phosphate dehydrogenase [NAD(P)+] n=1 Tax=Polynucleobacter kasalickyi TaxID=1938817 RepID=A0A1W2ASY9_9BURK|nr:NAD(P)H-dependent glycerol-3-phosphate dehydrogenase [Polynucleobacter kasalickyi]SMC63318.1 glycerol-3-phosphate dehydrogenase (NAD(P)+) [Polynucleobacter kasalickyi]
MNVTILGGGAWGTAIAIHLAKYNDSKICLWVRDTHNVQTMLEARENTQYLPGIKLPPNLEITDNWDLALGQASTSKDLIVIATPLAGLEEITLKLTQRTLPLPDVVQHWIWLCKGIDADSGMLPHEIVQKVLGEQGKLESVHYGVLSGPSFAKEVAQGLPCALTVASQFNDLNEMTQVLFHQKSMRIYVSDDVTGVELGGAIKNVLAIATGIADGLHLGLNARAALITRGMNEMSRIGIAMGAKLETFLGLAGLGDLILTATGDLSRNRKVGIELAKGHSLDEILQQLGHVAEGVRCAQAIEKLAQKHHVETPIIRTVCDILFRHVKPMDAVNAMMSRDPKAK